MKILLDARFYGLENAGLGRYTIGLVEKLSQVDRKNKYSILLRKKYFNELILPDNWKKILCDVRHYSFKEQYILPLLIKKENPNLVHFLHFNVPFFCPKPFIVTIHDILMHRQKGLEATTLNPFHYFIKRFGYRIIFDHSIKKALKIIVPSNVVKKQIIDFYKIPGSKIDVTYEGVEVARRQDFNNGRIFNNNNHSRPYFVYVGNAYPHKNLKRAIEAFVLVNKKRKDKVLFAIVSARNFFVRRLNKYVTKNNFQSFVKILGFVPDQKLSSLLFNSKGFLYPSLSEGFGLPGLEAMKSGTICLASDIEIFREIYEDNAIYFNPRVVESIGEAINFSLSLPDKKRISIIKKSQEFVKKYSWDKMAKETLKIYESCYRLRQSQ